MPALRRMLITAGPTHEPIDAVRYIANRSSGRLGAELAAAARTAGWRVTLLLGPVTCTPPAGVRVERFTTAADLGALLEAQLPECDVLIMAAAVADYRPSKVSGGKIPRTGEKQLLELVPTPDLVARCATRKRPDQRIIGFALEEPERLAARARDKLRSKGLDAIVANPLATMGSDEIAATVYTAAGEVIRTTGPLPGPALDKQAFARWLVEWLSR